MNMIGENIRKLRKISVQTQIEGTLGEVGSVVRQIKTIISTGRMVAVFHCGGSPNP
jgi:hypothetical protein